MLITVQIKGKTAVLVFDTASNLTILSPEITGSDNHTAEFQISFPESASKEDAPWARVNIQLHNTIWKDHRMVVKNQDPLSRLFGQKIEWNSRPDILNKFASVTIDFKAHCIMFKT